MHSSLHCIAPVACIRICIHAYHSNICIRGLLVLCSLQIERPATGPFIGQLVESLDSRTSSPTHHDMGFAFGLSLFVCGHLYFPCKSRSHREATETGWPLGVFSQAWSRATLFVRSSAHTASYKLAGYVQQDGARLFSQDGAPPI